ncbi:hypothetical protein [Streptomyces sp. NRRL F-5126]|uniref:hypothetical protein n=1 Tax=Streptomyces sp. NRRL F-5126 TaxID=1463857 RepID=UPI001F43FA77|nr:hypothetical protein [Streptomyces sp. NRRL F-5126]
MAAVRLPLRIVVFVVVLPVRMVWDALGWSVRAVNRAVLRPLGRGLVWAVRVLVGLPLLWAGAALWRWVVVPVVRYGVVVPSVWLYRHVLTPFGRGAAYVCGLLYMWVCVPVANALAWLGMAVFWWPWGALWRWVVVPVVRYGVVVPLGWAYRSVLIPVGRAAAWLARAVGAGIALPATALLVVLLGWLWRTVLVPLGRELGAALALGRRAAGFVSRAVGRAVAWIAWHAVGRPVRWMYRAVVRPLAVPVLLAVRDAARAARATLRHARADLRRAVFGAPPAQRGDSGHGPTARLPEPREPNGGPARTLGSKKTVPGAAPAPEVTLSDQG